MPRPTALGMLDINAKGLSRLINNIALDGCGLSNKLKPATLYARELFRTAQLLRRQRRAHLGFDQCDIRGTDRAIRIHVFAEI